MSTEKTFLRAFRELKKAVGGSPDRLRWAMRQDPGILVKAARVSLAADELKTTWLERRKRTIPLNFPEDFRSAYQEFSTSWSKATEQSRKLWIVKDDHGNDYVTDDLGKDAQGNDRSIEDVLSLFLSAPPLAHLPQSLRDFDPKSDDAFACIEDAMFYLSNMKDDDASMRRAVAAWSFLRDTQGVCVLPEGFAERWRAIPAIHVSGAKNEFDKRKAACLTVYEETARVFALGYYLATFALCRSALERTLVSLYRTDPLQKLEIQIENSPISPDLKHHAHRIQSSGNRIMHVKGALEVFDVGRRHPSIEADILEHLQFLRTLIESAPEPDHRM